MWLSSAIQAWSQIIIELSDLVDISRDEEEIGEDMDAVHTRGLWEKDNNDIGWRNSLEGKEFSIS